jgi:hypothetical protein
MRTLIALAAAAVVVSSGSSPALARQGCGPGFHRAYNGMCRANRDTRMQMRQVRWTEGRYYAGRGYWWHNRWYQHRHRRNGVWIYL